MCYDTLFKLATESVQSATGSSLQEQLHVDNGFPLRYSKRSTMGKQILAHEHQDEHQSRTNACEWHRETNLKCNASPLCSQIEVASYCTKRKMFRVSSVRCISARGRSGMLRCTKTSLASNWNSDFRFCGSNCRCCTLVVYTRRSAYQATEILPCAMARVLRLHWLLEI